MAAIGLGPDDVEEYLKAGVVVACENSPKSVTLAGDRPALEAVVAQIKAARPDVLSRMLQVDKAYHSHHMAEIGEHYHALIQDKVQARRPAKLFFSSVTGDLVRTDTSLTSRYWQQNLQSPVLFHSAVRSILQHPIGEHAVFLEVGPHSALTGPLQQIQMQLTSRTVRRRHGPQPGRTEALLTAIGRLHLFNVPVDFQALFPTGSTLVDLPRYPWNHAEEFWHEARLEQGVAASTAPLS